VPVTLSVAEITALCDRLEVRSTTFLLRNEPEQARDCVLAGRVIRALLRNVNRSDVVTVNGD